MRRMLRTALLLVMVAPGIAAAQDAVLSGTVTDSTGLLLPGVTVEVRSTADDQAHTAVNRRHRYFHDHGPAGRFLRRDVQPVRFQNSSARRSGGRRRGDGDP